MIAEFMSECYICIFIYVAHSIFFFYFYFFLYFFLLFTLLVSKQACFLAPKLFLLINDHLLTTFFTQSTC